MFCAPPNIEAWLRACRRHLDFGGLSPPNKAPSSSKLKCETLLISVFFVKFQNFKPPYTNVKSSSWRDSGDDSVGNEQRQGIILYARAIGRRPTARPSVLVTMKATTQTFLNQSQLLSLFDLFYQNGPTHL